MRLESHILKIPVLNYATLYCFNISSCSVFFTESPVCSGKPLVLGNWSIGHPTKVFSFIS